MEAFLVPAGTVIEVYGTTLHYAPCHVEDGGFQCVVVLPKGTNTPLKNRTAPATDEEKLLLQCNKWVIAHPDREPLIRQGAFPGLLGENRELRY